MRYSQSLGDRVYLLSTSSLTSRISSSEFLRLGKVISFKSIFLFIDVFSAISFLMHTSMILSRCWGVKFLPSIILGSGFSSFIFAIQYPSTDSQLLVWNKVSWLTSKLVRNSLITLNVVPLSWLFKFYTFSKIAIAGCLTLKILHISKNNCPWSSQSKPCIRFSEFFFETPAIEKGWQGNPARSTSCSGIKFMTC